MRIIKRIITVVAICAVTVAAVPTRVNAEIFYLQGGRRFDSDFYANYYPDLKAKYGYDAHKLLDPYLTPYVMEETTYVRLYPPFMLKTCNLVFRTV